MVHLTTDFVSHLSFVRDANPLVFLTQCFSGCLAIAQSSVASHDLHGWLFPVVLAVSNSVGVACLCGSSDPVVVVGSIAALELVVYPSFYLSSGGEAFGTLDSS